jgi:hypothetical protein
MPKPNNDPVLEGSLCPTALSGISLVEDIDMELSVQDADFLQTVMADTAFPVVHSTEDEAATDKPPLAEHCVILKSKKSAPTKGTQIWKEHVRFVKGKTKNLTPAEIQELKDLQDLFYRCSYGGDATVTFWVEANPANTPPGSICSYLDNVPYVPATEDCIRDEVKNNGVFSHRRTLQIRKRKKLKDECQGSCWST